MRVSLFGLMPYPAKGQPFHRGVEVQVLENAYGEYAPLHDARRYLSDTAHA